MYNKDYAIAAQNAATAAATLLQGTGAGIDTFESVRQAIFEGTMTLGGMETVITTIESSSVADNVTSIQQAAPQPQQVPATQPTASHSAGDLEFRNGKHSGKTIAQVYAEDSSYITWAADNLRNDFMKNKCREYLNAVAA